MDFLSSIFYRSKDTDKPNDNNSNDNNSNEITERDSFEDLINK